MITVEYILGTVAITVTGLFLFKVIYDIIIRPCLNTYNLIRRGELGERKNDLNPKEYHEFTAGIGATSTPRPGGAVRIYKPNIPIGKNHISSNIF